MYNTHSALTLTLLYRSRYVQEIALDAQAIKYSTDKISRFEQKKVFFFGEIYFSLQPYVIPFTPLGYLRNFVA